MIDAAGATVKIKGKTKKVVQVENIEQQVCRIAKVSLENLETSESNKLSTLDNDLKKVIYGQDTAVDTLVDAVYLAYSGLREQNKTLGSFLFTGPSGDRKSVV